MKGWTLRDITKMTYKQATNLIFLLAKEDAEPFVIIAVVGGFQ
jgi:hypothetical protein